MCNVRAEKKISMAIWVPKKSKILHLFVCVFVCVCVCVCVCVYVTYEKNKIPYFMQKVYIFIFYTEQCCVKYFFFYKKNTEVCGVCGCVSCGCECGGEY